MKRGWHTLRAMGYGDRVVMEIDGVSVLDIPLPPRDWNMHWPPVSLPRPGCGPVLPGYYMTDGSIVHRLVSDPTAFARFHPDPAPFRMPPRLNEDEDLIAGIQVMTPDFVPAFTVWYTERPPPFTEDPRCAALQDVYREARFARVTRRWEAKHR
jgi:hypothetical protein